MICLPFAEVMVPVCSIWLSSSLEKPSPEDRKAIAAACENAADAAYLLLTGRAQDAQARYNKKHEGADA